MADFQVKVEYRMDKFVSFFVKVCRVYEGEYSLIDLCTDIIQRCPSLSHLSAANLRIRYEDDEGSYINLELGDPKLFIEMWENAKEVPGREYRRVKLKACEINSPCPTVVDRGNISEKTRQDTPCPPSRRRLPVVELTSSSNYDSDFTTTSTITSNDKAAESQYNSMSTPLDRLFKNIEKEIQTVSNDIASKKTQLHRLTSEVESARIVNEDKNNILVCGQCHLREGHTKRNCTLGVCTSAKSCGMLDKHLLEFLIQYLMELLLYTSDLSYLRFP